MIAGTSVDELLRHYPEFIDVKDKQELLYLLAFRNIVRVALLIIPPLGNKQLLLNIGGRLEGSGNEYITGTGQKQCVSRRVAIYEQEGRVTCQKKKPKTNPGSEAGRYQQHEYVSSNKVKKIRLDEKDIVELSRTTPVLNANALSLHANTAGLFNSHHDAPPALQLPQNQPPTINYSVGPRSSGGANTSRSQPSSFHQQPQSVVPPPSLISPRQLPSQSPAPFHSAPVIMLPQNTGFGQSSISSKPHHLNPAILGQSMGMSPRIGPPTPGSRGGLPPLLGPTPTLSSLSSSFAALGPPLAPTPVSRGASTASGEETSDLKRQLTLEEWQKGFPLVRNDSNRSYKSVFNSSDGSICRKLQVYADSASYDAAMGKIDPISALLPINNDICSGSLMKDLQSLYGYGDHSSGQLHGRQEVNYAN